MRVFVYRTLVDYYQKHADAKTALEDWNEIVEEAEWKNFADIKRSFNSVDSVGNDRYIFNIKGNSYRIVAIVLFKTQWVLIRFLGTHAEYSKIKDCSKL